MLFKSVLLSGAILAFSATEVWAHAAINPALGVKGTAVRNDVQRPSANKPCGNTALTAIDSSTAVKADASGSFTVNVENFNGGKDGSRSVTMQVDAAGTGAKFANGQVTVNGDAAPATTGTQKVTASLPAGTKCSGGASRDLCLASFKTAGGFGNCVVVQQGAGGGAAAGGAAAGGAAAGGAAAGGAAAGGAAAGGAAAGGAAAGGAAGNAASANNGAANGNAKANGGANAKANGNANAKATGGANKGQKANANAKNNRAVAGTRLARYVVVDDE
ncbi:hypothetical protein HBH98_148510 [Parastagonospora nodorum]|nr:hypothetical protein HBI10_011820 [Parastagonospora nodorum]KAH4011532.1 hypothetical protein HBI13_198760 [Parastagonospora nodorum]KAH4034546.1 hypothetical protein HBI09_100230 [Parastagonospora nodorum]KAH4205775.1 hypothetical protein HBI95_131180 [Parastagonospora nodorum]KAH4234604.1 hypothetical protein HBI05_153250 [Parastagonospora nodorum]